MPSVVHAGAMVEWLVVRDMLRRVASMYEMTRARSHGLRSTLLSPGSVPLLADADAAPLPKPTPSPASMSSSSSESTSPPRLRAPPRARPLPPTDAPAAVLRGAAPNGTARNSRRSPCLAARKPALGSGGTSCSSSPPVLHSATACSPRPRAVLPFALPLPPPRPVPPPCPLTTYDPSSTCSPSSSLPAVLSVLSSPPKYPLQLAAPQ